MILTVFWVGPQPEGGNRAIAPSKFSKTYVSVRSATATSLHHFAPRKDQFVAALFLGTGRFLGTVSGHRMVNFY